MAGNCGPFCIGCKEESSRTKAVALIEMTVGSFCVLYGSFKFKRYFTHEDKIKETIAADIDVRAEKEIQDKYFSMMTSTGIFVISNLVEFVMGYILYRGVIEEIPSKVRSWIIFRKVMLTLLAVQVVWNFVFRSYWNTFTGLFWILCTLYFIRVVNAYLGVLLTKQLIQHPSSNESSPDRVIHKKKEKGSLCCGHGGSTKIVAWSETIFSGIFLSWGIFKLNSFLSDPENVEQLSKDASQFPGMFSNKEVNAFEMRAILRLLAIIGDIIICLLEFAFAILLLVGIRRQNPRLIGMWVTFRRIEIYARAVLLFWSLISVYIWDSLCSAWWLCMSYFDIKDVTGYREQVKERIRRREREEQNGAKSHSDDL